MSEVTDISRGILASVAHSEAKLKSLVASILEEAVRAGAGAAEVSASEDCGLGVTVRMGELETVEFNRDQGFGITVYVGTRKGSASTSDSSPDAVREAVRAALNIARFTQEDPCHGLAAAELMPQVLPDLDLYHPWNISVADAERLALACEDVARADARVANSDGASVSTHQSCRAYGNTHGFIGSYLATRHATSCAVIAGEKDHMQRDHWYTVARRADVLEAPEVVGRKAAERTVARLEPGTIATGRYPVLFDAPIASGLIGHLLSALSGSALYRRASFLTDSLGRAVLPDCYSLVEYPLRTGGFGSGAFDADGVATREQAFIDAGRVASYVLGTYSARRLGLETTANAGGVHNLDFEGPHRPRQELLAEMGRGLLVTELMGQGINLVTGDYSRGAAGFWVENGEVAYPVQELTIASNLARMYLGVVASGDDLDRRGNLLTGSILVDEMTIATG